MAYYFSFFEGWHSVITYLTHHITKMKHSLHYKMKYNLICWTYSASAILQNLTFRSFILIFYQIHDIIKIYLHYIYFNTGCVNGDKGITGIGHPNTSLEETF